MTATNGRAAAGPVPEDGDVDRGFSALSCELRCALDGAGRLVTAEGGWERVLGWRPGDLIGWELAELVHPADRARIATAFGRVQEGAGTVREHEVRLAHRNGDYRLISWNAACAGGGAGLLAVGADQTQDRRSSESSRRALRRLRRENDELAAQLEALAERHCEVERFAAFAAHQLSEPLIIAESSAIMLVEELDPRFHDRLEAIGRSSAQARQLVDALLEDARTASGPLELRSVDVAGVAEQVVSDLGQRIDERRVTVTVEPLPTVHSEPRLLAIVLQNLLSNAVKYGPRNGGRVRIGAERAEDGWSFTVDGEGVPIAEEDTRRIFEPFKRIPGERRAQGTGLGLAICARLVHRLGGTLGVRPGAAGNVFYFVIPDPA